MKKTINIVMILIISLMFIPNVYASNNIKIDSVSLVDKSENVIELSKPTINDMSLGFDISYLNLGDYAKYKVVITNTSSRDYYINNETKFKSSDYLTYKYEFNEKTSVVKKNSSITVFITITYNKLVPVEKLKNGMYIENNAMSVDLTDVILSNPKTYTNVILLLVLLVTMIVFTIIKIYDKKIIKVNLLLIGLLLIPLSTFALEKITINVTTKITIEEARNFIETRYTTNDVTPSTPERDFWQYYNYIKTISFEQEINEPTTYDYKFDVSEAKNNSIIAYLVKNSEEPSLYDAYIMSNGYIYANPNSSYVFYGMRRLKDINNLKYYNCIFTKNMNYMFSYFGDMRELDVSALNTSNVETMKGMFKQDYGSEGGSPQIHTLDLNNFDTSKVKDMSYMFFGFEYLVELNTSSFDTSSVTDMSYMFTYVDGMDSIVLPNFNTSKVTNMTEMFRGAWVDEIDISSFDTKNVTNMNAMFCHCDTVKKIYIGSGWNVDNVTDSINMFQLDVKLPNFDSQIIDKTKAYAGPGGYLTLKS